MRQKYQKLRIIVPISPEGWDAENEVFVEPKTQILELEHSLVSISAWESKWHKPFFSKNKTDEETMDYIKCMTINENVDPDVYKHLTKENSEAIHKYLNDSMTATTFSKDQTGKGGKETITSELIYYWMLSLNIPVEFEHWHINRLMTLIMVCNIKNSPKKKRSAKDIMRHNAALNAARRQQFMNGSKG